MSKTLEAVYDHGRIELKEDPNVGGPVRVLVTFPDPGIVDLAKRGVDEAQAANLRARLATFVEDWESPEMAIYDDYDAAKTSQG